MGNSITRITHHFALAVQRITNNHHHSLGISESNHWIPDQSMSTVQVTNPKDDVGLSYAIEEVIIEARENGLEDHQIEDILRQYKKAVKEDRL